VLHSCAASQRTEEEELVRRFTRDETAKEVRVAILKLRASTKWTQPDFGVRARVSAKTVARWETGDRKPTRAQVIDVIHALREVEGVDIDWLVRLAELAGLDPAEYGLDTSDTEEDAAVIAEPPAALPAKAPDAPPAPAQPPRPTPDDVRVAIRLALFDTAEQLDISPRGLRLAVRGVLEAAEPSGYSIAELRALV
jgi:DNA-binding transcriptional regulator YiaG